MLFNFESTNDDGCTCTLEFEALTWFEALDYFVKFLRGSGYSLNDTSVGINADLHTGYEGDGMNVTVFSEDVV